VQGHAMGAWDRGESFRDRLAGDPEVVAALGTAGIEHLFDPAPYLANLGAIFERALAGGWGRAA
jgi:adenylosuccinate lyase